MTIDTDLADHQLALRQMVQSVAAERYASKAREWDVARQPLPLAERRFLAGLGLLGVTMPERYGEGRPLLDGLIALEELAKASPIAAWPMFEACTGPARVIEQLGTEEQKQRLLPPVIRGDKTIAVSISEPEAGSAATDMTTRGVLDGDSIVLSGTKRWCSGAGHAEQYLVYARLDDGRGKDSIGAVVVDSGADGLSFGPQESLMGFRGIGSADIHLDQVRVPARDVIVPAGGFGKLFQVFSIERLGNATMSLSLAQTALDRTVQYVQQREQFGRSIAEFQLVQGTIADMVIRVEAARHLLYAAARGAGTGAPTALASSIAKCAANEAAKDVTDAAVQVHGGYGYAEEYEIERLVRDSHGWALAGGTINIQKIRIASEYLGRRFSQRPGPHS